MKHTEFRRVFRGLLAASVVLPFVVFSKATLMTFGGPLVWLLGYPLLVVVLLAATAESKGTKRVHLTQFVVNAEEPPVDEKESCIKKHNWTVDPAYSSLVGNVFHRN